MDKIALVVDNNPSTLRAIKSILEKSLYYVEAAEDGLHALRRLETFKPDIIFIDLIMPSIGGDRLCRIIRNNPTFDSVYIAITSAVAAEEKVDYSSIGADACIAKGARQEFEKNIATVISRAEKRELQPVSRNILGLENVHEREITKELLATKKHYEIMVDQMPDSIIEVNRQGIIVFANQAAARLFGVWGDDLISTAFFEYFSDSQTKEYIKAVFGELTDDLLEIGENVSVRLNNQFVNIQFIPIPDGINQNYLVMFRLKHEGDRIQVSLLSEFQNSLNEIKTQNEVLPLCSFCKKVRNKTETWVEVDDYIHEYTKAYVSHGICPDCAERHFPIQFQSVLSKKKTSKQDR